MRFWVWIGVAVIGGLIFAADALKSVNLPQAKNISEQPLPEGTTVAPLQNALNALQRSADAGAKAMDQLTTLQGLLSAKDDNDPRYDTAMRNLSPETKTAMIEKYRAFSREKRNERGTIVFLIGREIKTESDLKFMEEVLNEAPCLSLSSCDSDASSSGHVDSESGVDTTLIYPQLVAIKSLGSIAGLESQAAQSLKDTARVFLERVGNNHRSEHVRQEAVSALAKTF